MTKDDIIRMAREAGFVDGMAEILGLVGFANFANLVALVAAAEREECAKVCEDYGRAEEMQAIGNDYAEAIRARGNT
jgi:hypothetical protein